MINLIQNIRTDVSCNLHFAKMFENLIQNHNYQYSEINDLINNKDNLEKYLKTTYNCIPNSVIIHYGVTILAPILQQLKKLKIKIVIIIDDIHQSSRIAKPRNTILRKTDYVLNTYGYQFSRFNLMNHWNTYYFPHSALDILPINNKPINKILISGALNKNAYPDRDFITQFKNDIVILQKKCGYRNNKKGVFGLNYYKVLNEYLCCFTDLCIRDYTLAKIFEICASGSLLLCTSDNIREIFEEDLGFYDGVNYISCNQQNMKEKIDYILNPKNRTEIDNIRKNGQKLIQEKHNVKHRTIIFHKILNNNFETTNKTNKKCGTNYKLGF